MDLSDQQNRAHRIGSAPMFFPKRSKSQVLAQVATALYLRHCISNLEGAFGFQTQGMRWQIEAIIEQILMA